MIRARLPAVDSHLSAALLHDLPVLRPVPLPWQTVPRSWGDAPREGRELRWADLRPHDLCVQGDRLATAPLRTVLDCARMLPVREAVALADAALHRGLIDQGRLRLAGRQARGPGAPRIRRACELADRRAESVNESLARVGLILVGLGPLQPQFQFDEHPDEHRYDLGLAWARVLAACESKAHHSGWEAVRRDIYVHDRASLAGWVLTRTFQRELWPLDGPFIRKVLRLVVLQPGPRACALRRR